MMGPTIIKLGNECRRVFRIGLRMYVFPPDPPVGDLEALHSWKPEKLSLYRSIKLILELKGIIKLTTKWKK